MKIYSDFDGIWTGPWHLINSEGKLAKPVSVNDSLCFKLLAQAGHITELHFVTSGGDSTGFSTTVARAKYLKELVNIPVVLTKVPSLEKASYIRKDSNGKAFCYLGDDISDIAVFELENCFFGAIPSSAPKVLKNNVPSKVYKSDVDGNNSFVTDALTALFGEHMVIDAIERYTK